MGKKIRIATFNVENLFSRLNFSSFTDDYAQRYLPAVVKLFNNFDENDFSDFDEFKTLLHSATIAHEDDKRQQTALALADADADIVCLQEVDNFEALSRFRNSYLNKVSDLRYEHIILHEGNDHRGIDVAAMAVKDFPLLSRSHASMRISDLGDSCARSKMAKVYPAAKETLEGKSTIFRRDCLELELRQDSKDLSIFVCHFKSMSGGRKETIGIRQTEALAVKTIIERKFNDPEKANWLIVGDLNDYRCYTHVSSTDTTPDGKLKETHNKKHNNPTSGLDPLLNNNFAVNLVNKKPEDQWTHYYATRRRKAQLDYILASPELSEKIKGNNGAVSIVRSGQPHRVPNTDGVKRYPRIGWDRPKASDHCPVILEFDLDALNV